MTKIFSLLIFIALVGNLFGQQNTSPQDIPEIYSANKANEIKLAWYEPSASIGKVGKYERLEIGLKLPSSITSKINSFLSNRKEGLNPFDPDMIDLQVILHSPSGIISTKYAFYYQPFTENLKITTDFDKGLQNEFIADTTSFAWRFRFAPTEIGIWNVEIKLIVSGKSEISQTGLSFECIPSDKKGYLKVSKTNSEKDRWMYYSETNEPFFAITNNISSGGACTYLPSQNHRQLNAVQELADVGGNFTRFELGAQSALPDWPNYSNYSSKLDEMFAFDRMVSLCETNDIYFTLFRHHVEVWEGADWEDVKWQNNPYKKGFDLQPEGYFTDSTVIAWQNKTLRYIFSRWGYSPNMTFYSYSEIDRWYSKLLSDKSSGSDFKDGGNLNERKSTNLVKKWVADQQAYIKNELCPDMLFCHTHATPSDIELKPWAGFFELSDVIGIHNYGHSKKINYIKRETQIEKYWKRYKKPIIMEEMGPAGDRIAMYCCTGIEYHNSIWSTSMMGDFGTGMDWWWDRGIHDFNYHEDLKFIQVFFEKEDLRKGNYHPQKWMDTRSVSKSLLENYALVSENRERALGWIHNSTFYWRNLEKYVPCLSNIIHGNIIENKPCFVAIDPFAYPLEYDKYACLPRQSTKVYEHENTKDFGGDKDYYTDNGGAQEITFKTSIDENPTFRISGLKATGLGVFACKREWYKIEFFSTHDKNLKGEAIAAYTQELSTNAAGRIDPYVPPMTFISADYSYKVTYLGRLKRKGKK